MRRLPPRVVALVIAGVGVAFSVLAARSYEQALQREAKVALERAADRFDLFIESKLEACGNLVRAIQLVLSHNPDLDLNAFADRIEALHAQRSFPSLQAAAYARRTVDPETGRVRYPTELVAPAKGNEALWGLDVVSQPANLAVLQRALETDEPQMSAPFTLVQHDRPGEQSDGVVIRLPVLSGSTPARNAEERRQRELGSIVASFRISTLLDDSIAALDHPIEYELRLRAQDSADAPLIYSSARAGLSVAGDPSLIPAKAAIRYGGQAWRLELLPDGSWYAASRRDARILGAAASLASLLLAAWMGALLSTRRRAEDLAELLAVRASDSEQRFRQLSDLLPSSALLVRRGDGVIDYINRAGRRLLALDDAVEPGRVQDFGLDLDQLASLPEEEDDDVALPMRDNCDRTFQCDIRATAMPGPGRGHWLLLLEDVTERLQLTAQLRYQASHDALTGLLNRREFDQRLQEAADGGNPALERAALLYLDLDQFKVINDTCGHAAGDQLLARVAQTLRAVSGPAAVIARLGGDEFGLLLPAASTEDIRGVAEQLREAVERMTFFWEGRNFALTASLGAVAFGAEVGRLPAELLAIADTTCYLAKEAGRNRVVVYDEDESASRQRRSEMDWVQRIREALAEDRFCLYFQELRALRGGLGEGVHFELLVRMRDRAGELVPPGAFIPAAERFGIMPAVDRWVVSTALSQFEQLHPAGGEIGLCAINLSGATMGDETFPAFLLDQLRRSAVPAHKLCFEITETSAVANYRNAAALIVELRQLGCKVALDDFGAGMSSFGYLKNLPVDYIKIDGSFIREIENDPMCQSIVRAVTEIGHQFNTGVVAEFVNSAATEALLTAIGVDFAQGFGIHVPQPIPAHRIIETVES